MMELNSTMISQLINNIKDAIHEYRSLSVDILKAIIEHHLDDLLAFERILIRSSHEKNT